MADLKLVRKIGEGAFGKVFEGTKDGDKCAIKVIPLRGQHERVAKDAVKEGCLLKELQHPNIVKCKGMLLKKGDQGNAIYIIMEYCGGGDLASNISQRRKSGQHFSDARVARWFLGVTKAVEYLHSKDIVHRDIKPMNILIHEDGTIKLGDFGLAKFLKTNVDIQASVLGTPLYAAPEVYFKQIWDRRGDMWSLGCTLYELAKLDPAFSSPFELLEFSKGIKSLPGIPKDFSPELKQAVKELLQSDPERRPSAKAVVNYIETECAAVKPKHELRSLLDKFAKLGLSPDSPGTGEKPRPSSSSPGNGGRELQVARQQREHPRGGGLVIVNRERRVEHIRVQGTPKVIEVQNHQVNRIVVVKRNEAGVRIQKLEIRK